MSDMDKMMKMAAVYAAMSGLVAGSFGPMTAPRTAKQRKRVPTMVTSSPEEIAAWNAAIAPKPRSRTKLHRKHRGDSGQHPNFPKARVHKQHKHELRDEQGAYTCVGATYDVEGMAPDTSREHVTSSWVDGEDMGYTARRKWLGGISAQRGY
jgi:hypothetical protein